MVYPRHRDQKNNQEMMGWQEFFLLAAPRVKIKIPTTGASSPPMAIVKMTIEGGRCAPGGRSRPLHPFRLRFPFMRNTAKMKGICGGNGCSGRDRPSGANRGLQLLRKWYLQAADKAPAVGGPVLTMLWGVQSSQQVIVTRSRSDVSFSSDLLVKTHTSDFANAKGGRQLTKNLSTERM
eukprot:scaffold9608_cov44-Cyclotella_meneghiniana.AAC.2